MIRDREGRTLEEFLAAYDPKKYDQPSITVDMVVFMPRDGRLTALLIKRGNHPFLGEWALPGGFMNMDETLEEAAARELVEETGVTDAALHPLGWFDGVDRDPRGRIVTGAFWAVVPEGCRVAPGDDAAAAMFVPVGLMELAAGYRVVAHTKEGPVKASAVWQERPVHNGIHRRLVQEGASGFGADHGLILIQAMLALREASYGVGVMEALPNDYTGEDVKRMREILRGRP